MLWRNKDVCLQSYHCCSQRNVWASTPRWGYLSKRKLQLSRLLSNVVGVRRYVVSRSRRRRRRERVELGE